MKRTTKAAIYLMIFFVVGIGLNAFHLIDYNTPILMGILKVLGICFLLSLFLRLVKINWDSAFSVGFIFAYILSFAIMYFDTESIMVFVNLIIAITLSLIFTKNIN